MGEAYHGPISVMLTGENESENITLTTLCNALVKQFVAAKIGYSDSRQKHVSVSFPLHVDKKVVSKLWKYIDDKMAESRLAQERRMKQYCDERRAARP